MLKASEQIVTIIAILANCLPKKWQAPILGLMAQLQVSVTSTETALDAYIKDTCEQYDRIEEMEDELRARKQDISNLKANAEYWDKEYKKLADIIKGKNTSINELSKCLEDEKESNRVLHKAYERAESNLEDALAENSDLGKANQRLLGKLHDEELACSKAHDDLAKLASILMSDQGVFEQLVCDTIHNGPVPRASKLVQIVMDNDPKNNGRKTRPGEIADFMRMCAEKRK